MSKPEYEWIVDVEARAQITVKATSESEARRKAREAWAGDFEVTSIDSSTLDVTLNDDLSDEELAALEA